jgi:hypothetical protein
VTTGGFETGSAGAPPSSTTGAPRSPSQPPLWRATRRARSAGFAQPDAPGRRNGRQIVVALPALRETLGRLSRGGNSRPARDSGMQVPELRGVPVADGGYVCEVYEASYRRLGAPGVRRGHRPRGGRGRRAGGVREGRGRRGPVPGSGQPAGLVVNRRAQHAPTPVATGEYAPCAEPATGLGDRGSGDLRDAPRRASPGRELPAGAWNVPAS